MAKSVLATVVVLLLGCGGGSGHDGGLGGPDGGLAGLGGQGGGLGGQGGGSGCTLACLATLATLVDACPMTGTCTQQQSGTTSVNICYGNGVKVNETVTSTSSSGLSITMNVKKNTTACYSVAMSESSAGDMTMAFKNPAGASAGTVGITSAGGMTVTCPGGQTTTIDSTIQAACGTELSSASAATSASTGSCTAGTCTY
jgi:hypothetical protein